MAVFRASMFTFMCWLVVAVNANAAKWEICGGGGNVNGNKSYTYCDTESIVLGEGLVTLWIKSINEKEINSHADSNFDAVMNRTEALFRSGYKPRLFSLANVRSQYKSESDLREGYVGAIMYEVVANIPSVHHTLKAYYQFDCKLKTFRRLSGVLYSAKGDFVGSYKETGWDHVPPDTFADNMVQLYCK